LSQTLKDIGARLKNNVRPNDIVGRFGGDEFSVIFTDIGKTHEAALSNAHKAASHVRDALLSGDGWSWEGVNHPHRVTFSMVLVDRSMLVYKTDAASGKSVLDTEASLKSITELASTTLLNAKASKNDPGMRGFIHVAEIPARPDHRSKPDSIHPRHPAG
jgi:GGDEF domain-containing protein